VKLLIITSEQLYPGNEYNSTFELSLAKGLQQSGVDVTLLSVYMITPRNLLKAALIKIFFSFKKNVITDRFSFRQLAVFVFLYFFSGKRYFVFKHTVSGNTVFETVGISKIVNENAYIFGSEWVKAGMQGFEFLKKSEPVDIVHGHSRFYFAISLANAIYKQYGLPYIITEHSSFYSRGLVSKAVQKHLQEIYDQSAFAVAVSNSLADKVKEVTGINQPLRTIANALSSVYEESSIKRVEKKGFTIISAGRFDENKNQALLIRAFARVAIPDSKLILVGKGETEQMLRSLAKTLNMGNSVDFKGHLPLPEVRELMMHADVLVVSSLVETFSVVTIEAHACGIPVISTPCGGPNDLIFEKNGILLKGFSEEEIAAAINYIYRNAGLYDASFIRNEAIANFGAKAIAGEYIKLYEKVINK